MNKVWILVCNSTRGRIFESNGAGVDWTLLDAFNHPEGRSTTSELVTGSAGRNSSQGASAHHNAMVPKTSPKEVEVAHFVHALAGALDQGLRSQRFGHLVLVAPPHVLGMLKKELNHELTKHLMATVDKDLEHLDTRALAEKLNVEATIPLGERDVVRASEKHAH